jgi:hypothetical protein
MPSAVRVIASALSQQQIDRFDQSFISSLQEHSPTFTYFVPARAALRDQHQHENQTIIRACISGIAHFEILLDYSVHPQDGACVTVNFINRRTVPPVSLTEIRALLNEGLDAAASSIGAEIAQFITPPVMVYTNLTRIAE